MWLCRALLYSLGNLIELSVFDLLREKRKLLNTIVRYLPIMLAYHCPLGRTIREMQLLALWMLASLTLNCLSKTGKSWWSVRSTLVMAHVAQSTNKAIPDMTKCGLPQLTLYMCRLMLEQGLVHHAQLINHKMRSPEDQTSRKLEPGMGTYLFGLQAPHGVLNVTDQSNVAATVSLVGNASSQLYATWIYHDLPADRWFPEDSTYAWILGIGNCESLMAIGKHKQGDLWMKAMGEEHVRRVTKALSLSESHARQRSLHLATSGAHQPPSNGLAERLVGLAKQTTWCLLPASGLLRSHWSYAMRVGAGLVLHKHRDFRGVCLQLVKKLTSGDHTTRTWPKPQTWNFVIFCVLISGEMELACCWRRDVILRILNSFMDYNLDQFLATVYIWVSLEKVMRNRHASP